MSNTIVMNPISLRLFIVQLITTAVKIVQCINEIVEASKQLLDFAQKASNLFSLLYHLRSKVQEIQNQDEPCLNSATTLSDKYELLNQLTVAFKDVANKLAKIKKFDRTLLWPLYKKNILAILARIKRLKMNIDRVLQDNVESIILTISKNTFSLPDLSQRISDIQTFNDKETSQNIIE